MKNLQVVDLSRVLAGPYCAQLLADMGADVIKIESPSGDENRLWGERDEDGISCNFASVNRGKRSLTLNLKHEAASEILHPLVRQADVVVQSFLPSTAAKLGVDAATLRAVNPDIIHCSISGYGERGELFDRPGYDLMMQAFSGVMSITGHEDDGPVRAGTSFIDMTTGLNAYSGILTALIARSKGAGGASVRVSLLETAVSLLGYNAVAWLQTGVLPRREGSGVWHLVPYQAFMCSDQFILAGATNDVAWRRFCTALGCDEYALDERFVTNDMRLANRAVLVPLLEERFRAHPVQHWIDHFEANGIAVSPVNTLNQFLTHPQVIANEMVIEARKEDGRATKVLGMPFKVSNGPMADVLAAPKLSAHTDAVLRERLGMDDRRIGELRARGVF
ncbi:CoA transferase [Mesorhizobium sp. M7A.F.Ca.US.006.01.1.1]|uniref:CaiB/BaiF CoA transferase family protein n=1 Tax=Mesorhizobium sp. M7A.F.Ca.US.006.01.1.1 TaxID=2496707 RepID=UPI0013E384D5|nr:CoA transferase [Mesorhizobium sp. M7A.F.Ca.US.006.01.1.1]